MDDREQLTATILAGILANDGLSMNADTRDEQVKVAFEYADAITHANRHGVDHLAFLRELEAEVDVE